MIDDIRIFSTCPQSKDVAHGYPSRIAEVARWSDEIGCTGMLIYADHSIVDPWLVAQIVLQATRQLAPLVAVQPLYMHPYTVAKMVASLGSLHQRPIWLNMVAGGFASDLKSFGDTTPHDHRYVRLVEYSQIIQRLLAGDTVSYDGQFYQVKDLRMTPPLAAELQPRFLMASSSEAGLAASIAIGATAVGYRSGSGDETVTNSGVRIGLIAHEDHATAWKAAWERFPPDRRGQLQHAMAMRTSDSSWQKTLGGLAPQYLSEDTPYWLWPFQNYATFCPYLVGDYWEVATEVARYLRLGYRTFVLDIPREANDLAVAMNVFRIARGML